jgi:outer membrane receptor protein involved in Fe transport
MGRSGGGTTLNRPVTPAARGGGHCRRPGVVAGIVMLLLAAVSGARAQVPAAAQSGSQTPASAQAPDEPLFNVNVTVIETAPLPGVDLPLEKIPAPVQTATGRDIEQSGALDLSDFLNRRLNGVHVNEIQGNPFQPDINYRGYTASPLLGTPQGLSVFMDGVRLNQPFGEVVSWDLIPRLAISSSTLMPGSNPLFGLNTLGGALSIQTKDGTSTQGTSVQAIYGNDRRRALELEHGGRKATGLHWYLAGSLFAENGWRDDSPSDVRQLFGKIGWQRSKHDVALTAAYADNSLTGNGLQEQQFLARDYASVYTRPDVTDNRSTFLNLTTRHDVSGRAAVSANAYYRDIRTNTLNGDINENAIDQSIYQPSAAERSALAAAGYTGVPAAGSDATNTPFPSWRCIGNVLLNDDPAEKCNGLINRTRIVQHNGGASGQLMLRDKFGDRTNNQLTVGAAYDRSRVAFVQSTELGYLNPDRSVTGVNAFGDGGVTGGEVDGEPYDARVDLNGLIHTWSLYGADTVSIGNTWHVTVSGRYNETTIKNRDRVDPGGGSSSLDGDHSFRRFNPAAGVTFSPSRTTNVYVGYSEGSRAATSIELGCANPDEPCKLPNAMAGDPPLAQVVTKTWEAGMRGHHYGIGWNVGVFHAGNHDDILFVTSEQSGFGYFKNFGETRRQGFELGATGRVGRVTIGTGYTYLNATFQSEETVNGGSNSTNHAAEEGARGLEGTIEIVPGDRVPLIPAHTLKAYADVQATSALSLDVDIIAVSRSYARGNENNQHQPDDLYYLGPGSASGYAVLNLGASYRLKPWLQLLAQVNNLLDRHYYTAAQLGPTGFTARGTFIARPLPAVNGEFPIRQSTFFAPGAPTRAWVGMRFKF